jgi:predicted Zn finger-like uncharacterized protein
MIVACPACSARFQYDESRFQGVKSKRFKCPKCAEVFQVPNPALDGAAPIIQPTPPPMAVPLLTVPAMPDPAAHSAAHSAVHAARPAARPTPPPTLPVPVPIEARSTQVGVASAKVLGMPHGLRFTLAFLTGPRASTVRALQEPVTVIGREEGDIITQDPESSRRHAQLEIFSNGTAWISDLGSTNGTVVDGERIDGPRQLQDRQEFTCGKSTFMLLIRQDDPSMD